MHQVTIPDSFRHQPTFFSTILRGFCSWLGASSDIWFRHVRTRCRNQPAIGNQKTSQKCRQQCWLISKTIGYCYLVHAALAKNILFFLQHSIAFSRTPGSDIGSDMSEPDVGTSQQSGTKNLAKTLKLQSAISRVLEGLQRRELESLAQSMGSRAELV